MALVSVVQLSERHPAFSQSSIRWLIFHAADNGLEKSGAISRVGKKVIIDEEKFITWAKSKPPISASAAA